MQTRKDLYQAHKLMTQRVALALLQGQPDAVESPMRRMVVASLCGVMVAVVVAAAYGIIGLLFKGGARNLERPGTLIIEKETGAKYAYSPQTRTLIPFLNYTSARLAMTEGKITHKAVSRKSLAKYERGPVVGIPGAPDALPDAKKLARAPWSLCVRRTSSTSDDSGVVSLVGGRDVGGTTLAADQGILVQGRSQAWLIWNNKRLKVSSASARVLTNEQPVLVSERWLNGLPQGPDFRAPTIPDWGKPTEGPNGGEVRVGQVFRVPAVAGSPERWYVQLTDGLAGISRTQARLLLETHEGGGRPRPPRDVSPAAVTAATSSIKLHDSALPESPPRITAYDPSRPLCAVYRYTDRLSTEARFTIGGALPSIAGSAAPGNGVDQVVLPGGGTLAGALPGPNQRPQSYFLVTAQGLRFPVATPVDLTKLGYSAESAVPVPANLLLLLREGPTLTSSAATNPVLNNQQNGVTGQ
jgi:ESX secretion system ATPase EccB